jgi:hypothetical protein
VAAFRFEATQLRIANHIARAPEGDHPPQVAEVAMVRDGQVVLDNLSELYEYMVRRLLHANLNGDKGAIGEVLGLLGEIREAWAAIGPQVRGQGSRATPPG